jgi:signal transduction histidine kinase
VPALGVAAAALAAAAALRPRASRTGALALAVGLALWSAGWVVQRAEGIRTVVRFPQLRDVLWLALYPAAVVALVAVVGPALRRRHTARALDALLVGSTCAAAAALAVALAGAALDRHGALLRSGVAFVACDVFVLALAAFAAVSGRPGESAFPLGMVACFSLMGLCNAIWLAEHVSGAYRADRLVNAGWPVAAALLAGGMWLQGPISPTLPELSIRPVVATAVAACMIGALGTLLALKTTVHSALTEAFAGLALASAVTRLALSVREQARFGERERRLIAGATRDGVWHLHDDDTLVVSPRLLEIVGEPGREPPITLESVAAAVHPDDVPRACAAVRAMRRDGTPVREDVRVYNRVRGEWRACVLAGQPADPSGSYCVGTLSDVTELRQADDQRAALAREIHDSVAQEVAATAIYAHAARAALREDPQSGGQVATILDELLAHTRESERSVRRLLDELRRADERGGGGSFEAELAGLVAQLRQRSGLDVTCDVDLPVAPPAAAGTMLAVIGEALRNADKHGGARHVAVHVQAEGRSLIAAVCDDGVGIDLEAAARSGRLGLRGMRERAEAAGGRLDVSSKPGRGTEVVLRLPIGPSP